MDSRCIFMAYGVIFKHLEVDNNLGGHFLLKKIITIFLNGVHFKRGVAPFF
jgi:hypothetical protein